MKSEDLIDMIGETADQHIRDAKAAKKHAIPRWVKWSSVAAACLCFIMVIPGFLQHLETLETNHIEELGPPHIVLDNRTFTVSPHLYSSEELPDGFEKAGSISTSGGFENCPFYLNPSIPEWVYVYHEVRTNGEVDETGTLIETEPHPAYVRYVDDRLRGKALLCYEGHYYISMWSADPATDVTEEDYQQMMEQYGVRMEGAPPDGFVFAGKAEFTGEDTVPEGILASNQEAEDVYYHPEHPEVLLMKTQWFTASGPDGETSHDGFDVYIQYDCPFDLLKE